MCFSCSKTKVQKKEPEEVTHSALSKLISDNSDYLSTFVGQQ